jgi:protein arginine kinase activator
MQNCTSCNSALATIQVLDLEGGSVVNTHFLCDACAKSGGTVSKHAAIKLSSEILENLLGGEEQDAPSATDLACPGCRLTISEFRLRGRLGCPRCYEVFRSALLPLLERVHDATCHKGRFPGRVAAPAPPPSVNLIDLRVRLQSAIEDQRYEDAARIRDELDRATTQRDADQRREAD